MGCPLRSACGWKARDVTHLDGIVIELKHNSVQDQDPRGPRFGQAREEATPAADRGATKRKR